MKHLSKLLVGAALVLPAVPSMAANDMAGMGSVGVYATSTKLNVPAIPYNESATGFGLKGWYSFGMPFIHGEYQTATLGDPNTTGEIKVSQLRLGGGATLPLTPEVLALGKLEYVSMGNSVTNGGNSDLDLKGPGVHVGAVFMPMPALHFIATVGYLSLSGGDPNVNSQGDTKGMEFNVGGGYNFTKEWGAFIDYRKFSGSFKANSPDQTWDVSDLRFGGSYSFGGK